ARGRGTDDLLLSTVERRTMPGALALSSNVFARCGNPGTNRPYGDTTMKTLAVSNHRVTTLRIRSGGQMPLIRLLFVAAVVGGSLLVVPSQAAAQKKGRNVITREEIENSAQRDGDIYGVIRALRPHFLQPPKGVRSFGGTATNPVALYVDKHREPDLSGLQLIMANRVDEVQYLDPSRSENEFGITA